MVSKNMLKYNHSHHNLPIDLPGELHININFIDNELVTPVEKDYLNLNTENYISKVAKHGIKMDYNVNHQINNFEIEFKLIYEVYTSNFLSIYTRSIHQLKNIIENTYFPYYKELKNNFDTTI